MRTDDPRPEVVDEEPRGASGARGTGRGARIALVTAVVVVVCTGGVCSTALALGPRLAEIAGCATSTVPAVSGVLDDDARVKELIPALGDVRQVHYRWREARPRTCPDLGPMRYVYEGFAVLGTDTKTGEYDFAPAPAPEIPVELAAMAPSNASWRRSPDFDADAGASIWLDAATMTVFFTFRR